MKINMMKGEGCNRIDESRDGLDDGLSILLINPMSQLSMLFFTRSVFQTQ